MIAIIIDQLVYLLHFLFSFFGFGQSFPVGSGQNTNKWSEIPQCTPFIHKGKKNHKSKLHTINGNLNIGTCTRVVKSETTSDPVT